MDVNNLVPEDTHHFDDELHHDDEEFIYHSEQEGGEEYNTNSNGGEDNNTLPEVGEGMDADHDVGSDSSADYNSNTDSENEIQLPRPPRPDRKRGMTRLPKLRTEYSRSGGKRKHVKFDAMGRLYGRNRQLFVSYLGDLVRQKVGISVYSWKDVTPEVRNKLWEEITVNKLSYLLYI